MMVYSFLLAIKTIMINLIVYTLLVDVLFLQVVYSQYNECVAGFSIRSKRDLPLPPLHVGSIIAESDEKPFEHDHLKKLLKDSIPHETDFGTGIGTDTSLPMDAHPSQRPDLCRNCVKSYPLPECYTNDSGYMCCNPNLEYLMKAAYADMKQTRCGTWNNDNIQSLTNAVEKRIQKCFGNTTFEVITGHGDFVAQIQFSGNMVCKIQQEGKLSTMNSSDICIKSQAASGVIDSTEKNLMGLFPLLYAIPSIILDTYIVKFMLSKEGRVEFRGIFSTLFAIFGIVEMSDWVLYNLIQRLSSAPLMGFLYVWIPKDGIIVSIFYFLVSYVAFLNHIPSLLLTINRFTSVTFPTSHERTWKKMIKPILVVYFLYPLIFSWQFLIMNQIRHCQIWDITSTISDHIFIAQPPYYGIPLSLAVTIISFLVSISCLVMNITTMVLLISRRKQRQTYKGAEKKVARMEINMFILTLLMFITEFAVAIMFLISYFVSPISSIRATILAIQPFIKDLTCLTPPWMLVIMSSKVRSKLFRHVFNGSHSTTVQSINTF